MIGGVQRNLGGGLGRGGDVAAEHRDRSRVDARKCRARGAGLRDERLLHDPRFQRCLRLLQEDVGHLVGALGLVEAPVALARHRPHHRHVLRATGNVDTNCGDGDAVGDQAGDQR